MENQLTILSESLDKKLEVLQKIREYNKRQEEIFSAEKVDMSLFDDAVEEKQRLIDEVVRLDEGFEILYEKLAKELARLFTIKKRVNILSIIRCIITAATRHFQFGIHILMILNHLPSLWSFLLPKAARMP